MGCDSWLRQKCSEKNWQPSAPGPPDSLLVAHLLGCRALHHRDASNQGVPCFAFNNASINASGSCLYTQTHMFIEGGLAFEIRFGEEEAMVCWLVLCQIDTSESPLKGENLS